MLGTLFLAGDVMTGRGVDQILPHPSDPKLVELAVRDARDYVAFAEQVSGPVPRRVPPSYIWGDALAELQASGPIARIVNLETSVTTREERWPNKSVHYRMHPSNAACLTAAGIDVCTLANNHVLDYGRGGLSETLDVLHAVGIATAGAGRNRQEAETPAYLSIEAGRIVVLALGSPTSGIPHLWTATEAQAGVDFIAQLSPASAARITERVQYARRPGDLVIASIHWGTNWGYDVSAAQVSFAHQLVDGGVDVVYGHSSHHPRPIEVYRERLILYGCGDFIDDYEGITGYEEYRGDLALMYFATLELSLGTLVGLRMVPMQQNRLRLRRPSANDVAWLSRRLENTCSSFGTTVERHDDALLLRW